MDSLVQSAQPVQAVQVDAQCAMCRSYVHRYLDRCPICGDGRSSGFGRAVDEWHAFAFTADPPLAAADDANGLAASPALAAARDQAIKEYGEAEARFRRAEQLVLRYEGGLPGIPTTHDVKVALVNRQLEIRDFRAGRMLMTIDPSDVLAAIPSAGRRTAVDSWSNVFTSGAAPSGAAAIWGGAFTVVFVRDGTGVQFGLANRPGFFTTKARSDYFVGLAREFADLCGAASRHRELQDGPLRYAHSIGLRAAHVGGKHAGGAYPGEAPGDRAYPSGAHAGSAGAGVGTGAGAGVGAGASGPGTAGAGAVGPATGDVSEAMAGTRLGVSGAGVAPTQPDASGGRTLAELLEQLEVAFRAGLVTAAERDAKRQEILRRF